MKIGIAYCVLALLCSCSSGSGGQATPSDEPQDVDFDFRTSDLMQVHLTVHSGDSPVRGALVQVREHRSEENGGGTWLWVDGVTNAGGIFLSEARIPSSVGEVELIVHAPGMRALGNTPQSPFEPAYRGFFPATPSFYHDIELTTGP